MADSIWHLPGKNVKVTIETEVGDTFFGQAFVESAELMRPMAIVDDESIPARAYWVILLIGTERLCVKEREVVE